MCTPRLLHDLHPPAGAIPDVGLATTGREADLFPRHAPLERLAEGPDPPARSWVVWATAAVLLPAVAWHRSRVHSGVVAGVVAVALLTSACGLVVAIRNRPPGRGTLAVAGVGAILTLVQSILAAVELARGSRPPETATYIGYLVGIVVVLPLAVAWAVAERTRWSGVVVAVGGFTVAIMTARLVMLARGTGA